MASRPNTLLVAGLTLAILALSLSSSSYSPVASSHRMVQFSSQDELQYFLKNNSFYCDGDLVEGLRTTDGIVPGPLSMSSEGSSAASAVPAHSGTNNQVSGVDELDTVKNDGWYVYNVNGNKLVILKAYPATEAGVASTVTVNGTIIGIFVRGDKLAVFGQTTQYGYYGEMSMRSASFAPYWGSTNTTIWVYDVADRTHPILRNTITVEGSYVGARMIGDFVYVVASQTIPYCAEDFELPKITMGDQSVTMAATSIYHSDLLDYGHSFTNVAGFDISQDGKNPAFESFLLGTTGTMYVSSRAIFLTSYIYNTEEGTVVHRVSIDEGTIVYEATGQVPGHVLNQFSMDEYNGYFRVATQTWNYEVARLATTTVQPSTSPVAMSTVSGPSSGVYVLDSSLTIVGKVEGLGAGETFHAARFMGYRAYLVTFKKIDPLFVVDLSNPRDPRVLGELKITGYSDYLHPFDENFVIGIGKEADDQGSFAWYQGVKVALFDVSDPANPKEAGTFVIGDRGTESPVLSEHKALLFDRERSLLVMPVTVAKLSGYNEPWATGERVWQGAYVFTVNPQVGVVFRGGITHLGNGEVPSYCYYGGYYESSNCDRQVSRSLFIGEVLYTLSPTMMKMNSLTDLAQINVISF